MRQQLEFDAALRACPARPARYRTRAAQYPANTTLIASLSLQGIGPSLLVPGATDGLAFETYVEQVLAPSLQAGQIEARGCELWFQPSYSPDLSPIEAAFAKFKQALRRIGARTLKTLYDSIS